MPKYILKLTEQEELNLRQFMVQPTADVLLKLLQHESLNAQAAAMDCTSANLAERGVAQMKAQVTGEVVSALTAKLLAYREQLLPDPETDFDPLGFNIFSKKGAPV